MVRAGDVESCLYYVHFETVKDAELLHDAKESLIAESPEAFPPLTGLPGQHHSLPRKPVSPMRSGLENSHHPKNSPHLENNNKLPHDLSSLAKRKPVGHENANISGEARRSKLVGPRPLNGQLPGLRERDLNSMNNDIPGTRLSASLIQNMVHPTYDQYAVKQQQLDELYASNGNIDNHFASSRLSVDSFLSAPALTLIRRHGTDQCNVSKILADGTIEMNGEGYQKFKQRSNVVADGNTISIFRTRLERKHAASDDTPQIVPSTSPSRNWRQSAFIRHLDLSLPEKKTTRQSQEDTGPTSLRRTIFATPWGSPCQFAASIGGRSLQCSYDAPGPAPTLALSELRLNLPPSQGLRPAPRRPSSETGAQSKRSSFMHLHRRGSSENDFNENDHRQEEDANHERLDLKLGQEHAGGGFGGKQAKLGKLIIHPEGFPMLDLLVAGNIALWSRVYKKCR